MVDLTIADLLQPVSVDPRRRYVRDQCAVFRKTAERFGGLSNMAAGFPLLVEGVPIRTSEALYQACRFPHLEDVQKRIIHEPSPMGAKIKSKKERPRTRPDWDQVRVPIMRWCLRVKLAQNWDRFSELLLSTGEMPIVEESHRDTFWGTKVVEPGILEGANVLGQLLDEIRELTRNADRTWLLRVPPLPITEFLLYDRPIGVIGKVVSRPSLFDLGPTSEVGAGRTGRSDSAHEELGAGATIGSQTNAAGANDESRVDDTQWMKPAWLALLAIVRELEGQEGYRPIGHTLLQRIAYVASREGIPMGFSYRDGDYGLFSSELQELIARFIRSGLVTEERMGNMNAMRSGPRSAFALEANDDQLHQWRKLIGRIAELFTGMPTRRANILVDVLFISDRSMHAGRDRTTMTDLIGRVAERSERRKEQTDCDEITRVILSLVEQGWIAMMTDESLR